MNKNNLIFLLLSISFTVNGQQSNNSQISQTDDRVKIQNNISSSVLQFAQNIIKRAIETNNNKFEVISPVSIVSALQLALLGAKGKTFDEIVNLMNYGNYSSKYIHEEFGNILKELHRNSPNPEREIVNWRKNASDQYLENSMRHQSINENLDEHKIEVANGIFVLNNVNIRREYKEAVEKVYGGEFDKLNFRDEPHLASQRINSWVNEKTHGKIPEIVPPVMNPNTRVVLANALYFNAEWQQSFMKGVTMPKKFYQHGRRNTDNFTMFEAMAGGGEFPHYFDEENRIEILGLPYKQNCTTMYVIMPKESSTQKIKEVQSDLTAEKIENLISKMTIKSAVMLIPKMTLRSGYHLKPNLQELGVNSLFNVAESDLSIMTSEGSNEKNDLIFFPKDESQFSSRKMKRAIRYKTESENIKSSSPLSMKDFLNRKRILKNSYGKKNVKRSKRDTVNPLVILEQLQKVQLKNPHLYADEVIHKVELTVNEKGTQGGAATAIAINRTTAITFRVDQPFIFIIRHDPTKTILFYGVIFEPPVSKEMEEKIKENTQ